MSKLIDIATDELSFENKVYLAKYPLLQTACVLLGPKQLSEDRNKGGKFLTAHGEGEFYIYVYTHTHTHTHTLGNQRYAKTERNIFV